MQRPGGRPRGVATYNYNRWVLASYDVFVLGFLCRHVWRCPRDEMLALYDRNVGERHLEIGPGTGFFLDNCHFPVSRPSITLLDRVPRVLDLASRRIARLQPETLRRDVLQPLDLGDRRFDSVGLNFFLHCLPGDMTSKAQLFDEILHYVEPGGRVFGSTLVGVGVPHSHPARLWLYLMNKARWLCTADDSRSDLENALATRFAWWQVSVRSSVVLFTATR